MDSVLYRIIEIERAAQKVAEEGDAAKQALPKEIEAEKQRLAAAIEAETARKIQDAKAAAEQERAAAIKQVEETRCEQLDALRALFAENRGKWEDALYDAIIGKK